VNAVLPAQSVSFEDARSELREAAALDRARRIIDSQAESYEDLLAGGATLEELVAESEMELGNIDWSIDSADGIAAYEDFRAAAATLTVDDFAEIMVLEDGGIFAMRLDEELPQRPNPFDDARDDVSAALEAQRTENALSARAEELAAQLRDGTPFAELGLDVTEETDRTRGAFVPRTPPGFLTEVFQMEPDDVRVIAGSGLVVIAQLASVSPVADSDEAQQLRETLQSTLDQALAQDLFDVFASDVTQRTEVRIDQAAVDAVNMNFP
jgi:peptidyl-prolyl cis-trans isomerase D